MKSANIIYFGTPEFSATILESLITNPPANTKVVAVVTNPDSKTGRKQLLTPSPVAQIASKYHLPTFKPTSLDNSNLLHIKLLNPDLFVVAAYGKIIPQNWLDLPKIAPLNVHFSLLPKYRGALCIQEAIKNEDKETGVTLMEVDAQMDHGNIISQMVEKISIDDDVASLTEKLTQKAISLLQETLPEYLTGNLKSTPQDHSKATHTPSYRFLTRDSSFIPWSTLKLALEGKNSTKTHALIRSLNPDPGAWTKIDDSELKLLKTSLKDGKLEILTIQTPGKTPISFKQFLQGKSNLLDLS